MKVKYLIEMLTYANPEAEVCVFCDQEHYEGIAGLLYYPSGNAGPADVVLIGEPEGGEDV